MSDPLQDQRRSTINIFRSKYSATKNQEEVSGNRLKRTWKEMSQPIHLVNGEQVRYTQTPFAQDQQYKSFAGCKLKQVTDSKILGFGQRSVVSFRQNSSFIRVDFPVYKEEEVGKCNFLLNSLIDPGDDDDDHETSDSLKNYFIKVCKQDLYDALLLQQEKKQDSTLELVVKNTSSQNILLLSKKNLSDQETSIDPKSSEEVKQ